MTAKSPRLRNPLWRKAAQSTAAVALLAWPLVASSQETVTYYTTDAIGSVRMVTDSGGAVVARYDYRPFGDPCGSGCGPQGTTERRQFAGAEKDAETSLDYFGARHYANQLGRFTTVDPDHVGGNLFDPQSWNGYAYARNNPLRFTDPDGREYEVCGYGGSGGGGSCGTVSDQYFAILAHNPKGGLTLWGGAIFAGNKVVGHYRQTRPDATFGAFASRTAELAAAELKYGTIGMGMAAGAGAAWGLAAGALSGGLGQGGLTTLSGESGLWSDAVINRVIGSAQRGLLRRYIKTGRLPQGLEARTLHLYRGIAKDYLARFPKGNPAGVAEQTYRLKLIEAALKQLP